MVVCCSTPMELLVIFFIYVWNLDDIAMTWHEVWRAVMWFVTYNSNVFHNMSFLNCECYLNAQSIDLRLSLVCCSYRLFSHCLYLLNLQPSICFLEGETIFVCSLQVCSWLFLEWSWLVESQALCCKMMLKICCRVPWTTQCTNTHTTKRLPKPGTSCSMM